MHNFDSNFKKKRGLVRDLNPGPLAPKARIIPLDQRATVGLDCRSTEKQFGIIEKLRVKLRYQCQDEVAEWLRRWTANPMCSARVGSNPILVVSFALLQFFLFCLGEMQKGSSGIRTRDLSHPKRESYP